MAVALLLVQIDPDLHRRLQAAEQLRDVQLHQVEDPATLTHRLERGALQADGVVLGAAMANPLAVVHQLRLWKKDLAVLIVCMPAEYDRVRQGIQASPLLGSTVTCHRLAEPDTLIGAVLALVGTVRQRQHYQALVNTAHTQLAAPAPPRPHEVHYLDHLLDQTPMGVIALDSAGVVTVWNRYASTLFGIDEQRALRMPLRDVATGMDQGQLTELIHQSLDGQAPRAVAIVPATLRDGRVRSLEISAGRVHLPSAEPGVLLLVHDVTDRLAAERENRRLQEEIIRIQELTLHELATPLIPISDAIMIMPLIGTIDSRRAQQVLDALLHGIARTRVTTVILDITGVPLVDTQVANVLIQAAQSVKLLGAQVVLTGIRPEVAQTLVGLGVSLQGVVTLRTLQLGIAYAATLP
jgi:anti-anti-sigma factor